MSRRVLYIVLCCYYTTAVMLYDNSLQDNLRPSESDLLGQASTNNLEMETHMHMKAREAEQMEQVNTSETTNTNPEQEDKSEKIEKECEEQMKTKLTFIEANAEVDSKQEHEKDCFFQCLFQKHDACDEKGNVIEKNVVMFFINNSPFKDKQKLKKITRECCKKAKDNGKVVENVSCNPYSNYVYHCVYEEMHMAI